MLSTISPAGQQFVNSINDIQARLAVAQQQVSSGSKVSQPSDEPDQISPILQLHSAIQQNTDIQNGLNTAMTTLKASDDALSNALSTCCKAPPLPRPRPPAPLKPPTPGLPWHRLFRPSWNRWSPPAAPR
jgi:hypothetical protein